MLMLGVAALMELSQAGLLESEFTGGAAGRGGVVVFVVVFVVVAAVVDESGGVEDLGLSPAEGDGVLTSSTGLF